MRDDSSRVVSSETGPMFHRIVSLALVVCFLPLPNANSVVAWERTIFAADSTWSDASDTAESEADEIPYGRISRNPLTIDSESLIFCELENEVRENESKDGEDNSFGLSVWCIVPSKHMSDGSSQKGIAGGRLRHSADITSRYHVLRC